MKKVNLFIVGSVKCATTSLYEYLSKLNEVYLPIQKEPHHFIDWKKISKYNGPKDSDFYLSYPRTYQSYSKLFDSAPTSCSYLGDASTMYLADETSASQIFDYNPDAKIIAIVRNPVERAYSHFLHHIREDTEITSSLNEAIDQELNGYRDNWAPQRRYLYVGRYFEQLKRYYDLFDNRNILVLEFEDLVKDSEKTLHQVHKFLKLDIPNESLKIEKFNSTGTPRFKFLHNTYSFTKSQGRKYLSFLRNDTTSQLRRKIDKMYRNRFLKKNEMDASTRLKVIQYYKQTIVDLQSSGFVNIDKWMRANEGK